MNMSKQQIRATAIFERSVDPTMVATPFNDQIFETPNLDSSCCSCSNNKCHHCGKHDRRPSLALSPSTTSHIITENYVPSCLDATTEVLSNNDIDLDSVNVLSTSNTRRSRSSSMVVSAVSTPSPSKHRNSSISRRLSEIYFNKRQQQQQQDPENGIEVVPFYSYYDMVNSERITSSRQSSLSDDDVSYMNDSNLDTFFLDADYDENDLGNNDYNDNIKGEEEEEEEVLSVQTMGYLLKCKSYELRGK